MGDRTHAADRLLAAIDRVGSPVCVGIDPVLERLPVALRPAGRSSKRSAAAIRAFSLGVLDAVATAVPCVKFQSACFERFGQEGVGVLESSIAAAKDAGLEVLLDAKRGDIGISAEHYARAVFGADERDQTSRHAKCYPDLNHAHIFWGKSFHTSDKEWFPEQ